MLRGERGATCGELPIGAGEPYRIHTHDAREQLYRRAGDRTRPGCAVDAVQSRAFRLRAGGISAYREPVERIQGNRRSAGPRQGRDDQRHEDETRSQPRAGGHSQGHVRRQSVEHSAAGARKACAPALLVAVQSRPLAQSQSPFVRSLTPV